MTSFTKPEVDNVLHCRQRRTEPRWWLPQPETSVAVRRVSVVFIGRLTISGFVFGRKWQKIFVFVFVSVYGRKWTFIFGAGFIFGRKRTSKTNFPAGLLLALHLTPFSVIVGLTWPSMYKPISRLENLEWTCGKVRNHTSAFKILTVVSGQRPASWWWWL